MRNIVLSSNQAILAFLGLFVIVIVVGGWCFYSLESLTSETKFLESKSIMPTISENKKIAMIIAFRNFRDEEYFITKATLEDAGADITTVSESLGKAIGSYGEDTNVDLLLDNLKVTDYDAIVFVGGSGAYKYFDNERCHQIAKETLSRGKILAAICASPTILAKAGVLDGKKATVWSNSMDKSLIKILKDEGAIYRAESVVKDGNIITGNGPAAAKDFAQEIIKSLTIK
jgi:protease I